MKATSADRKDFISYPTNRVVGTVADAARAREAINGLLQSGFEQKDIDLLHGEEDLHRLDPTGAGHGFLAQFKRTLIRNLETEEFKHLTHHIEDVRAGRCVIMVLTRRREQRIVAGDILHQHGSEFVGFYGRWAWADVPPSHRMTPADVPPMFVQAWNQRDPDALASLFDGDGEFVDATGAYWQGRESIRDGYAARLPGIADLTMLATGETNVKLLLPEVAVVHAHLTLSGEAAADSVAASTPRTSIVSFVVHRVGERWLCASAHNTDVISDQATI
ncbi:MAG: SgcJ/EcaC family oxidoreductase [Vicinamibacterales bacterium]